MAGAFNGTRYHALMLSAKATRSARHNAASLGKQKARILRLPYLLIIYGLGLFHAEQTYLAPWPAETVCRFRFCHRSGCSTVFRGGRLYLGFCGQFRIRFRFVYGLVGYFDCLLVDLWIVVGHITPLQMGLSRLRRLVADRPSAP